jgi:hypothetical protein
MFYFKDGKRVLCKCPLSDKKLKDWGIVLVFGSGSASSNGYKKLKEERTCLVSEDDAKRDGVTLEKIIQEMKFKVANIVERTPTEQVSDIIQRNKERLSEPSKTWYDRSQS